MAPILNPLHSVVQEATSRSRRHASPLAQRSHAAPTPSAAAAAAAANVADDLPDVETTNWNAVKLLASKYGIQLRSYEEEEEAAAAAASASAAAAAAEPSSAAEAAPGASAALASSVQPTPPTSAMAPAAHLDEEHDLVRGTPFRITASRLQGGRVVYRFKLRSADERLALAAAAQPGVSGLPRSESDSVALASSSSRMGARDAYGASRPVAEGASPSTSSRQHGIVKAGEPSGPAASSSVKPKALRTSRSIPTLRGLPAAQHFMRGVGAFAHGQSHADRTNAAAGASETAATTATPAISAEPRRPSAAAHGALAPWASRTGGGAHAAESPSTGTSLAARFGSASMSRAISQPVRGSLDHLRPGSRVSELQGGDVLGAILQLRNDLEPPPAKAAREGRDEDHRQATASSGDGAHQSRPYAGAAAAPLTGPSRRDAQSDAQGPAPALGIPVSDDVAGRTVSPFGQPVLRPSRDARRGSGSRSTRPEAPPEGWKRSPIPEMAGLGQPFSFDVEAFRATSPSLPPAHSSPAGLGGVAGASAGGAPASATLPSMRALREMQSFESSASASTAKGLDEADAGEEDEVSAAKSDPFHPTNVLFDVLQYYRWHDAASDSGSKRSSLAPSSVADDDSSSASSPGPEAHHRRSRSAARVLPSRYRETETLGDSSAVEEPPGYAAPGDDPRFCLWAVGSAAHDGALVLTGRRGVVNPPATSASNPTSSPSSSISGQFSVGAKRWSLRGGGAGETQGSPATKGRSNSSSGGSVVRSGSGVAAAGGSADFQRPTLIAASLARLVAELTSEIDNVLLTDFFYTYRTLMTPSELLHLLVARFHWALLEPTSAQDEGRRRIVRVRTYVVLKYWLLHFFETDYLPDRALRRQLTDWLNELVMDPRLPSRPADMSIVKSLRKIVRNLKSTYQQAGMGGLLLNESGRRTNASGPDAGKTTTPGTSTSASDPPSSSAAAGRSRTEAESATSGPSAAPPQTSSSSTGDSSHSAAHSPRVNDRVDLEIEELEGAEDAGGQGKASSAGQTGALPAALASGSVMAAVLTSPKTPGSPRAERRQHGRAPMLAGPAIKATVEGAVPANASASASTQVSPPPPLPTAHSALSRAFVNTVGRLSRFKRVLGSRGGLPGAFSAGVDVDQLEGLEFEANDSGDLLFIRGGLENFISFFNLPHPADGVGAAGEASGSSDLGSHDLPSEGTVSGPGETTPSLTTTSAPSGSTPASSLELPRAGDVDDDAVDADDEADEAARSAGLGIKGAGLGSGDEVLGKMALDAANLRSFDEEQRLREERLLQQEQQQPAPPGQPLRAPLQLANTPVSQLVKGDALHHTTSEQTLRSVSTAATERRVRPSVSGEEVGASPPMPTDRAPSRMSTRSALSARSNYELRRSENSMRPNIVQIDDVDLSSDEDDGVVRRALRRLPGARDLRVANHLRDLEPIRQSLDSISQASFGRVLPTRASTTSMASSFHPGTGATQGAVDDLALGLRPQTALSSYSRQDSMTSASFASPDAAGAAMIGTLKTELFDPDEALAGYELVRGFRLDVVDSDSDDEPGDVEAALRRLEGVIDEEKQREKARRVERMLEQSLARNTGGGGGGKGSMERASVAEGSPRASDAQAEATVGRTSSQSVPDLSRELAVDEARGAAEEAEGAYKTESREVPSFKVDPPLATPVGEARDRFPGDDEPPATKRSATKTAQQRATAIGLQRKLQPLDRKGATDQAAQPSSGGTTRTSPGRAGGSRAQGFAVPPPSSKFGLWNLPPVHRSFLLAYKSDTIAQQLCLIEAELFKAIHWEELVSGGWNVGVGEVLDWEAFYQGRVRGRAEAQSRGAVFQESAVEAIIARFNLTSNWVASEIVLTQSLEERVAVVSKFIRVAFRCYQQSNFATLTQILFGLQSPWVARLRRTWAKVGMYEMRMMRDLKNFTSPLRDFSHLRNALRAMRVDSATEDLVTGVGPGAQGWAGGAAPPPRRAKDGTSITDGCVPFFGLFLSDLISNDSLPKFIDPSAPASSLPVRFDASGALVPAEPHAFDSLRPLPPGMRLEPLANVYKVRKLAATVKTVLAFQNKARAYTYEADAGAYLKCLRIRCLSGEQMTHISHLCES